MLGRYVVLEELGRGGMSVVYAAYDPELDRRVALKVVRGDKLTETHRARLHREAQALARLSHPNVVAVFDVGDLAEDTFVAMELVDGQTLRQWLQTPRSWRAVIAVAREAGRGLAAAHAAGIVHRDVKPDNVIIAATGAVKVVDFGLARDLGDRSEELIAALDDGDDLDASASSSDRNLRPLEIVTHVGHIVGTPAYMPPEQRLFAVEADARADQFSFCATLYEALYRQRPFAVEQAEVTDRSAMPTAAMSKDIELRSMARIPPRDAGVPAWLEPVVMRGLAIDPVRRFPTMDALLAELARDPERTRRRVALGVGATLAVAGVAALATWQLVGRASASSTACRSVDARALAVWSGDARDAVRQGGAAHGAPWAAGAATDFIADADQYVTAWSTMRREACQATRVRGEQSAEALDLRMACLDHRLDELAALAALMRTPSASTLRGAGQAVALLSPIADCADTAALRQVVRSPTAPAIRARLQALDGELARATALYAVGDVAEAARLGASMVTEARAIDHAPTLATTLYWYGRSLADGGGGGETQAVFEETFAAALRAGDDRLAADAASRVAQEELWVGKLAELARWQRITHALVARTGAESVGLFVDQLACMQHHFTGKVRTRLRCLEELATRHAEISPLTEWLVTTLGLAATEAGALAKARGWLERGVELAAAQNGVDHPRTLEMSAYLCQGLNELGDYDQTLAVCGDALRRLGRIAPDDQTLAARLRLQLGVAEARRGDAAAARAHLDTVAALGDDDLSLSAASTLADLDGVRGDVRAAVAAHRQTLAATIEAYQAYSPDHYNILLARYELGRALYFAGDVAAATAELDAVAERMDLAETSPLQIAQDATARAELAAAARPPQLARARQLVAEAQRLYAEHAPDTARFRKERARLDAWVATLK